MSERGAWMTEYTYCNRCLETVRSIITEHSNEWTVTKLANYPILAGKAKGMYAGEEIVQFETDLVEKLEAALCHPVRFAVIAEQGQRLFWIHPRYQPKEPKPATERLHPSLKTLRKEVSDKLMSAIYDSTEGLAEELILMISRGLPNENKD